jgi:hypothetical protein
MNANAFNQTSPLDRQDKADVDMRKACSRLKRAVCRGL